jgi:glycosyltransferase involved in cell wall biosynthesis
VRVLHLTDRLTDRGGAHRHLLGVLEALGDDGHQVVLAAGGDDRLTAAPCPVKIVAGLDARTRAPAALDGLVAEVEPDLIHVHTVVNPAVLEWAADRPTLMTVQDHRYFCPSRGKWTLAGRPCAEPMAPATCAACFEDEAYLGGIYDVTAERLAAVRRLRIVVLSHYMKRELVAAGVAAEQVAVVPPFVHGLDPHAAADGPPCVLFVGRLTAAKGVGDAVDAWRVSGLDLPLVVAGTGPLRAELESWGVEVRGWVGREALGPLYRRARALLMPSRWQEPFGIAGLEALSMGVPVVAWDSGGIAEWHPGPLPAWGDVRALAAALRRAVGRRAVAPAGFDRKSAMRRLVGVYEEVALAARAALPLR